MFVTTLGIDETQKEKFIARLIEQAEKRRLPSQDGEMGAVDGELAKARELRDVSMIFASSKNAR